MSGQGHHDLSRITIIIPTFERPRSIERQFEYWTNQGPNVFILDGSKEPHAWASSQSGHSNVSYVHDPTSFCKRRLNAGRYVSTEFAILLPDDEFHLRAGLIDCVRFLDANPEVIGCAGRVVSFFVDQSRFLGFVSYEDWRRFSDDCVDAKKRLEFSLPPNKAHKVEFSLFRSEIWKRIFSESYSIEYSCGFAYERLLNLYSAVLGRTELIDSALWMRSLENPPTHSKDVPRLGQNNFVAWATSGLFQNEVDRYLQQARGVIREARDLTDEEVDVFAQRFLFGGIRRQMEKERRNKRRLSRKVGAVAIRLGPRPLKRLAKRLIPSQHLAFTGWRGEPLARLEERLSEKGISFSSQELKVVEALALKYATSD